MSSFSNYPAYKPASVPWLQQVPEQWGFERAKSVFRAIDVKSKTGKEELLTVSSANGIVKRHESNVNMFKAKTYVGHKLCWPEDLVINSLWAWGRGLGFSREHGIISTAYGVYRLREEQRHLWQYLDYTLRSSTYQWELQVRSKGVWKSRLQLTDASFFDMPILMPPREDADLIVRYLHGLETKVKRYIRTKRKLIAALQEQKQAIIQRAVTRGLNPNVKLKPSGVEWLGEVPVHWEVVRFKRLLKRIEQGVSPQAEAYLAEGNAWGVLKAGCVNRGVFRETEHKRLPNGYEVDESLQVKAGDVLVSRASGSPSLVGSVGIVEQINRRLILSDKTFRPVFRAERIKRFCVAAMNTPYFRHQVEQAISGAEGLANNLPLTSLKDFNLVVPPEAEAEEIATSLSRETRQFDVALRALEGDINLMQEYHTRLIADVVTGAVDVRAAAKTMAFDAPEVVEEEPLSMAAEAEAEYGEREE